MKYGYLIFLLIISALIGCSDNDEPLPSVFMQPSAITTTDANGQNQTFVYDDYGRIIKWIVRTGDDNEIIARYSYPTDNTILVDSEETSSGTHVYNEIIYLEKGRALNSEGTFIDNLTGLRKSYQLEYSYDFANHLTSVKHSEVVGIGADISEQAWDNAWRWENYLIWHNNNLVEFQDMRGKSYVYSTTKFKYMSAISDYPLIIYPAYIINSSHHLPLIIKGIFGATSRNMLCEATQYDSNSQITMMHTYDYIMENNLVTGYYDTRSAGTAFSSSIFYNVSWTAK